MREPNPSLTLTRLHHTRNNYLIADAKQASAKDKQAFYSAYLPSALVDLGCTLQRVLAGTGPRVRACIAGALPVRDLLHVVPHHIPSPVPYSAEAEMNYHEDNKPSERTKLRQLQEQVDKFFLKQNGSFRRKPTPCVLPRITARITYPKVSP